ncbi:MAG: AzlC family ABC transporter permease [Acidiferrobacterales bacterium]|nr:AzlC family ABC transporter permease [Acidiferrobacterales bacterium]
MPITGFWRSAVLGAKESTPFCVSTFLFGILFGVAATASGLSLFLGLVMSGATFSASAQFAAMELWSHPLPVSAILLSVFLVSSRNILLGLSITNHIDGHSLLTRLVCLGLLSDPGVVMVLRASRSINNLGYLFGYGAALWVSWVASVWLGFAFSNVFTGADIGALAFAGPLVMTCMMMLFVKGGRGHKLAWVVSGISALLMAMVGLEAYLILPVAVMVGIIPILMQLGGSNE